ncbi:metallophosphoesterase [Candidatus Micrarchaeota archaeon]|nr:metallophosphoesterase [Candidatus Micrarchaeota archaeon]
MKIAIIGDTHLGYARFEDDSFKQASYALEDADKKADVIVVAGDVFDSKIPKLETIKRAVDIFSGLKKPAFMIHGNHERRSKDMVNPVQLLASLGRINYVHGETILLKDGEKTISITMMGSVPEELAESSVKKVIERQGGKGDFNILVIHQSLEELTYSKGEELSMEFLSGLGFDLIVNGHIHKYHNELNGKLLIPGSTVITQLRKDEQGERGYIIYDTEKKDHEFVKIVARLFFHKELNFENASLEEVRQKVKEEIEGLQEGAIFKIKLKGNLKEGLSASDLHLQPKEGVYIQNEIGFMSMGDKIAKLRENREQKLSIRENALKRLVERLSGKVKMFNPIEMFENLVEGVDAGEECLGREKNNARDRL